jgi:hypothetical protein
MVHEASRPEELAMRRRTYSVDHAGLEVEEHHAWYVLAARGLVVKQVAAADLRVVVALAGGSNYPENGLVKPPRRDTRALSPAGVFGGKAPLRLAAQKSRPHAP